MADEQVSVGLSADNKSFVKAFNEASQAVRNVVGAGNAMVNGYKSIENQIAKVANSITSTIRKSMLAAAAATAGVGITAVRAASQFGSVETAMANVATVTDRTKYSMSGLTDSLAQMSQQFPRTIEELASGLYEVESAGFQGAEALKVLNATTKFSIAGVVDMGTSVRATTSIINAYGLGASNAVHVTDVLFKAVEEGQMTASEFAMNIGDWASSAASLGVSFESASAALAVMTTKGAMPANLAATSLNSIMRALIRPSEQMTKTLKRMGYESGKAALESKGFAGTLGSLWEAAGENETRFAEMFQDVEGFRGALGLVTKGYDSLTSAQERFNDVTQTNGTTQRAFEAQMDTLATKTAIFKNELRLMTLQVGSIVVPIFKTALGVGTGFLSFINGLPMPVRKAVAVIQLLAPALLIAGGALAVMTVKARIWEASMARIAATKVISGIPGLAAAFTKIGAAGGPLKALIQQIGVFNRATTAMKASMLRTAAQAVATAAVIGALSIIVYQSFQEFDRAKKAAREYYEAIGDPSVLQNVDQMKKKLADVNDEVARSKKEIGDGGFDSFFKGVYSGIQFVNPFDKNTITRDAAAYQVGIEEMQSYQEAIFSVQRATAGLQKRFQDMSQDQAFAMLDRAVKEGVVDWEEFVKIMTAMDKIMLSAGDDPQKIAEAMGSDAYMGLSAELDAMVAGLVDWTAETKKVDAANAASSASSQELELAIIKIGDAASTSSDRLEAYKTILDQLLGNSMGLRDAEAGLYKSLENVGAALRDNGANFDLATEGGQAVQSALSGAADSAMNYSAAILEQTGSQDQATVATAQYIQGMIGMAQEANFSAQEIATMVSIMGATPETLATLVSLPGIDPAIANLLMTAGLLDGIDGYVAQASVMINTYVDTSSLAGIEAASQGKTGISSVTSSIQGIKDFVESAKKNITPKKSSGGGGGGGGAAKWKPSATQLRNLKAALATPLMSMLTGAPGQEYTKQITQKFFDNATKGIFMEGKTRLGAAMLRDAQKSGQDPAKDFEGVVEDYNRLVKAIGKSNADLAMNQFESADDFKQYVDAMEEMIQHQQEIEDWRYSRMEIGFEEYKAILAKRLSAEEQYSSEWMSIQDQMKQVEDDRLTEQKRIMEAKLTLEEISANEYLNYLYTRLNGYQKYSKEWMDIWGEINDLEDEEIQKQQDRADAIKSFADEVAQAFADIKKSVEDPILRATSLISAFGDQATMSRDQVQGFYSHMMEGTQRWVTAIKELKARGMNASFINELIQAGPQSVGFAESVLALGAEGIGFINQSMTDINNLASGLGTDIAKGSVGQVINNDNSLTIQVGDVSIVGEMPGGVTVDEVTRAIQDALANVATGVANRQPQTIN